jgi:phosphotransferase system enzyme I (PtsI)
MLKSICAIARERDRPVTLCGEMAADPFHVPLLIGLGLRTLSMSATSIPIIKRLIRRLSTDRCQALVDRACRLPTAGEVEAEVARCVREWAPEFFGKGKTKG